MAGVEVRPRRPARPRRRRGSTRSAPGSGAAPEDRPSGWRLRRRAWWRAGPPSLAQVGQPRIAAHGEGQDGDRRRAARLRRRARILAASARVSGDGSSSSSRAIRCANSSYAWTRTGAIAGSVQQRQQPAERGLVVRQQVEGAAGPGGRLRPSVLRARPARPAERPPWPRRAAAPPAGDRATPGTRSRRPPRAARRGRGRDRGRARAPGRRSPAHCSSATASQRSALSGTRDLLVAARRQDLGSEPLAEKVERAAEGGPRVLLVEVGPEEGEERVAPVEPPGSVGGEVGQDARAASADAAPCRPPRRPRCGGPRRRGCGARS